MTREARCQAGRGWLLGGVDAGPAVAPASAARPLRRGNHRARPGEARGELGPAGGSSCSSKGKSTRQERSPGTARWVRFTAKVVEATNSFLGEPVAPCARPETIMTAGSKRGPAYLAVRTMDRRALDW